MINNLTKQPAETIIYEAPFPSIPVGASITSVDSIVVTARGKVAEVLALSQINTQFSGTAAQFTLGGGTDGEEYLITVSVTDSLGENYEYDAELRVEDFTWAVPDGVAGPYLSPAEYVTRFGYGETQMLSDTHDVGRIDKDRLGARLLEATAMVDGYVSKRYVTPLSPVPEIIKGITADLARFSLHADSVPDVVESRHKLAKQSLKDISAGSLMLPAPEKASGSSSGAPDVIAPDRIFNRATLKGF